MTDANNDQFNQLSLADEKAIRNYLWKLSGPVLAIAAILSGLFGFMMNEIIDGAKETAANNVRTDLTQMISDVKENVNTLEGQTASLNELSEVFFDRIGKEGQSFDEFTTIVDRVYGLSEVMKRGDDDIQRLTSVVSQQMNAEAKVNGWPAMIVCAKLNRSYSSTYWLTHINYGDEPKVYYNRTDSGLKNNEQDSGKHKIIFHQNNKDVIDDRDGTSDCSNDTHIDQIIAGGRAFGTLSLSRPYGVIDR